MLTRPTKIVRPALAALACATASTLAVGVVATPSTAAEPATTFINAGGPSITDSLGRTWSAESRSVGGWNWSTSSGIADTTNPRMFQSERAGMSAYNIPVADARTYRVTLYFAEIYHAARGKRVFSVTGEGRPMVTDLDIFASVGKNRAMMRSVDVPVTDGTLNLRFSAKVDSAKLSGIAVAALPKTAPAPAPTTTTAPAPAPTTTTAPAPAPTTTTAPAPAPAPTAGPACTTTMAAGGNVGSFINGLSAGAVGCLPGGSYGGSYIEVSKSGTSSAPITVQSVPGQTAKIATRMAVTGKNLTFRGLDFDTDHKIGTSNVWLKSGAAGVTFEGNRFADSGIAGGTAHDGQCLYSDSGTSGVKLLRNLFTDCGSLAHFHHAMYVNGTGYTIANNVVLRTKAYGIHLYPNLSGSVVANNTVDGSGRAGVIVAEASSGNRVVNNVLTNNAHGGVDGYAVTGSNTVQDNLCFANGTACVEAGNGFTGSGNVTADPQYLNRTAGDLRTSAGSPAVNTGNAAYAVGPDKNGVTRPQGGAPDKGAFER